MSIYQSNTKKYGINGLSAQLLYLSAFPCSERGEVHSSRGVHHILVHPVIFKELSSSCNFVPANFVCWYVLLLVVYTQLILYFSAVCYFLKPGCAVMLAESYNLLTIKPLFQGYERLYFSLFMHVATEHARVMLGDYGNSSPVEKVGEIA